MSALQENGSTLASVIGSDPKILTQWESFRLSPEDSLPPAQFHKIFWGKSMANEEQKWRDDHPPMLTKGTGLGNKRQGGDELMDVNVDVSEEVEVEEGDDDDIIEGCHFLEIDIEDIEPQRIWIRAEYIRIYNALEVRYRAPVYPKLRASAVIITGQPGIGKSVFIFYALCRRLAEKKPVIWYYQETRYLFVEEGVYEVPNKFQKFKFFVWTLVDSDYAQDGLPKVLIMQHTRHFSIYCTSPNQKRWSRLHKIVHDDLFIMNPWKRKEILRLLSALPPDVILCDDVNRVFDELGPTPRICIDYLRSHERIERYRKEIRTVISGLTTSKLEELFRKSLSFAGSEVSDKLCLISRQKKENLYSGPVISFITTAINSRLSSHLRKLLARAEQIRLYKLFAKVPDSRAMAGVFFEAVGHGCLQDGVTLELLPMVQLSCPSSRSKNNPWWCSSHVLLRNKTLEEARQLALQKQQSLSIPPGLRVEEYKDNGPSSVVPDVIYLPELTNQVAFDSFILMNNILYIFQFTLGKEREIKPGLFGFMDGCTGLPSMDKWRFVFVHPPNHTLISPQPQELKLRVLLPWSAKLDPNEPSRTQPDIG